MWPSSISLPPLFLSGAKAAEIPDLIGSDQKSPYEKEKIQPNLKASPLSFLFYFSSEHFILDIQGCLVGSEMLLSSQPLSFFLIINTLTRQGVPSLPSGAPLARLRQLSVQHQGQHYTPFSIH